MKITDMSLDSANGVSVQLFKKSLSDLPAEASVGDIVRLHRTKVCVDACLALDSF